MLEQDYYQLLEEAQIEFIEYNTLPDGSVETSVKQNYIYPGEMYD